MDSNTHSTSRPDQLGALVTAVDGLAAQDLDGFSDAALADQVQLLRRQLERQEGQWLRILAALDARGAAGADQGVQAPSTAGWLRARLRLSAGAAHSLVRTARALFRGPLTATAQALTDGELSLAHAQVLAAGTQELPAHVAAEAEPVLLEAARRLDPPRLRRAIAPSAAGGRSRRCRPPGRAAASAAGVVAVGDLGGHGRGQRAAGR